MGWAAGCHLVKRDAEAPDVCLRIVVWDRLGNLWCHPIWGSDERIALRLVGDEQGRDTKVTEHNLAGSCDEDVGGFDVAVDYARFMQ